MHPKKIPPLGIHLIAKRITNKDTHFFYLQIYTFINRRTKEVIYFTSKLININVYNVRI
jgi:hypothetical protein